MRHKLLPFISIVIPAYNESTMLPLCLKFVCDQDYKGNYEIIVVDNSSSDETPEIVKSLKNKNIILLNESRIGVSYARATGFKAARGEIIASTDADTIVPRNWLTLIAQSLEDTSVSGLVGAYKLCNTNTLSKKFVQILVPLFRTVDLVLGAHFAGANFAIRKDVYEKVGGFDHSFITGEDLDLSYRVRKEGYDLKVAYHIMVKTSARRLNEGFWNTFINYVLRNWFSLVFFHHPYLQKLTVVREQPKEIEDFVES